MRKNTPEGDSGANESVQLFISTDRKLQMTGRDSLYLKILRSVTRKFQDFGGEVFEDGSHVDSSFCSDAHFVLCVVFEKTLDTAARKL